MQKRKTVEMQAQREPSPEVSKIRVVSQDLGAPAREPMTGAQANALRGLAEEIMEPHAFDSGLSKSEASRRIHRLQERLRLWQLPPHTD
jgi:hypothetical protein